MEAIFSANPESFFYATLPPPSVFEEGWNEDELVVHDFLTIYEARFREGGRTLQVPPTSLYSYAVSPGDTIVAVNDFPVWSLKDLRTQRSANPVILSN